MNAKETAQVLQVIAAHYWRMVHKTDNEQTMMVATWTEVFADVPREPHVNRALAEWFLTEKWPPQASELHALAMEMGGPTPAMIARSGRARIETDRFRAARDGGEPQIRAIR